MYDKKSDSKNTKNRMDFEQMDVTRKESIISPMESLDRVANTMSKHVALDEWIEYNTNKWVATYGDLIETKGFPWGGPLSLKGSLANSIEAKARLAQAKKVRERIQLTTGIHDVQIGEKIQDRLLTMGEWMSRNGANISKKTDAGLVRNLQVGAIYKVANVTTRAAGRNFVTDIKSLNTFSFITMNPFRQLLMNEPRGHADMYGCVLTPPNDPTGDFGIVFLHNEGYSTMCGHAIIAISTLTIEMQWVEVEGDQHILFIDAPCGRIMS